MEKKCKMLGIIEVRKIGLFNYLLSSVFKISGELEQMYLDL